MRCEQEPTWQDEHAGTTPAFKADSLRAFVMTVLDGTVIGFYALSAHAVNFADLTTKFARTRPSHGNIPAAYISMIGVDQRLAGLGYGGDLLVDALCGSRALLTPSGSQS
jgi:hypothetical protein